MGDALQGRDSSRSGPDPLYTASDTRDLRAPRTFPGSYPLSGASAAGPDIRYAFNTAEEIEFVCELYCRARSMGKPVLLSEADMEVVLEKFKSYGQRD